MHSHASLRILPAILLLASFFLAPQASQAALYAPGATLDPACAPTDSNCGIASQIGSGTTGQVPYYAANGSALTATSSLTILSSGYVGIATTSPYAVLSIAGAAGGTSDLFAISTSTAGYATTTALRVGANGNLYLPGGNGINVGYGTTAPPANGAIFAGNVGIGSSNPTAALEVSGTAKFNGITNFYGSSVDLSNVSLTNFGDSTYAGQPLQTLPTNFFSWAANQTPLITVGASGDFDAYAVDCPTVTQKGNLFYVFYHGWNSTQTSASIGLATGESLDSPLTKQGVVLAPTPGAWDSGWVAGQ